MELRFVWDEHKHKANLDKHGISFEEAESIWLDPLSLEFYDLLHSVGEDRFIRIGCSFATRLLLVVFGLNSDDDTIRLISARKATRTEREVYEKGI